MKIVRKVSALSNAKKNTKPAPQIIKPKTIQEPPKPEVILEKGSGEEDDILFKLEE